MSGKGGNWERDVCKKFSKWVNGTVKPYVFWRGAGSGGVFTKSNLVGERFAGDVYHVREEGKFLTDKFSIEAKTGYETASLDKHLKYNKSDPLKSFWEQTVEAADAVNKYPMLIYKKKGMPIPWLGITEEVFKKLFKNYLTEARYIHLYWGVDDLPDIYFFDLDYFLENVKPMVIKSIKGRK